MAAFDGMVKKKISANKMQKTMHEFKHHDLHSGSKHGPMVTSRKQAIAIGLNEAKRAQLKRKARKR